MGSKSRIRQRAWCDGWRPANTFEPIILFRGSADRISQRALCDAQKPAKHSSSLTTYNPSSVARCACYALNV